jgi:hypothetical protein
MRENLKTNPMRESCRKNRDKRKILRLIQRDNLAEKTRMEENLSQIQGDNPTEKTR